MADNPTQRQYWRNQKSDVIHTADCPRTPPAPAWWTFAKDATPEQITEHIVQYPWLRACAVCRPDRGFSDV